MFNCFGYSRVVPTDARIDDTSTEITQLESSHTATIMIGGVGTSVEYCFTKTVNETMYRLIDYSSKGLVRDVINAKDDLAHLHENKQLSNNRTRLFKLTQAIKDCLTSDKNYERVVVIGVSHGSLLVHGAILRLKMDLTIPTEKFDILHVVTLGSPRYLPKGLTNHVYNFYNMSDTIINLLRRCRNLIDYIEVPNQPSKTAKWIDLDTTLDATVKQTSGEQTFTTSKKLNKTISKYYSITENHCTFVENEEFYCFGIYNIFNKFITDNVTAVSWHHSVSFNLFPLLRYDAMYFSATSTERFDGDTTFNKCEAVTVGGHKNQVKFMTRTHNVKRNKANNANYILVDKQKIYLSSIRGKYRYITGHTTRIA